MEKETQYGRIRIKKIQTLQKLHILKASLMLGSVEEVIDVLIQAYEKNTF